VLADRYFRDVSGTCMTGESKTRVGKSHQVWHVATGAGGRGSLLTHTVLVWWVVYTARISVGRTRHVHRFEVVERLILYGRHVCVTDRMRLRKSISVCG
jgi:hypothetical protein